MKSYFVKFSILFIIIYSTINCKEEDPIVEFTLKTNIVPEGTGSVVLTPSSDIYKYGEEVVVVAVPNEFYKLDYYGGDYYSTESVLNLTMDSNKTITINLILKDTDEDGVTDDIDNCPDTPTWETANTKGCSINQADTDGDSVMDSLDSCPNTPIGELVNANGCSSSQIDTDGDGVVDSLDNCSDTRSTDMVDENGCSQQLFYLDENGVTIKCYSWVPVGATGEFQGEVYRVIGRWEIESMLYNNQDLSKVCTTKITDMSSLFISSEELNLDISSWDVSNVTNMNRMFSISEFNGDISNWDVCNVINMQEMFDRSKFNGDISSWDVSSVTNMSRMFMHSSFNNNINSWDVSNVTSMESMFYGTPFNQDISLWDVTSVDNMHEMFMYSGFNQDVSAWDVSNVTNMHEMFFSSAFNQDVSLWNVSNVVSCGYFVGRQNGGVPYTQPIPNFTNCTP